MSDAGTAAGDHATVVGGIIGAGDTGFDGDGDGTGDGAYGIAPAVTLRSYDTSDDLLELAAVANQIVVSNHSYGEIVGWEPDSPTSIPG